MNSFEQRQAARKQRLEARAGALRTEGEARLSRARKMADIIPSGQPILIGHHSEKGDRSYRAKIHANFGKGFDALKAAGEMAARAASRERRTRRNIVRRPGGHRKAKGGTDLA